MQVDPTVELRIAERGRTNVVIAVLRINAIPDPPSLVMSWHRSCTVEAACSIRCGPSFSPGDRAGD
jgi:hypothetical protein